MFHDGKFPEINNSADACCLQQLIFIHFQRCDFHVDPPYFSAMLRFYGICSFNGFHEIFQTGTAGMFAAEHQQALVTFPFQNLYFLSD